MVGSTPLALTPEVDAFRREFERLSDEADRIVRPLTDEQFTWNPSPASWSIAQCIDHLNIAARLYLPALDEGIADAIRRGLYSRGPFSYDWVGRVLVRSVEPSSRLRVKASTSLEPPPHRTRREIMAAFPAYQVQFVDRLRQASGLDLARARVASPVSRWIRIPLGSGFAMMAAHERRHLAQARRVMDAPGFP